MLTAASRASSSFTPHRPLVSGRLHSAAAPCRLFLVPLPLHPRRRLFLGPRSITITTSLPRLRGRKRERKAVVPAAVRWEVENNKLSPLGGRLSASVFPRPAPISTSDSGAPSPLIANFKSLSSPMVRICLGDESRRDARAAHVPESPEIIRRD